MPGRGVQPVQVGFNPAGTHLYVTERRTDRITRYAIGASGTAGAPRWTKSAGAEPWGFDWTASGLLVVSEAGDHANDGSSASSYRFGGGSAPITVSGAVPWLATFSGTEALAPGATGPKSTRLISSGSTRPGATRSAWTRYE